MSDDIVVTLKKQAEDAADSGYVLWQETMLIAAKEIKGLRQELDAAYAAHGIKGIR